VTNVVGWFQVPEIFLVVSRMTEDDIIFDDVYELCEVISKYVFAV